MSGTGSVQNVTNALSHPRVRVPQSLTAAPPTIGKDMYNGRDLSSSAAKKPQANISAASQDAKTVNKGHEVSALMLLLPIDNEMMTERSRQHESTHYYTKEENEFNIVCNSGVRFEKTEECLRTCDASKKQKAVGKVDA